VTISEDAALKIAEHEPYLSAAISDIPNAYGG